MQSAYFTPEPGSVHHVKIGLQDRNVSVYLSAQASELISEESAILQCWTNLPRSGIVEEKEETSWHAIDLGRCSSNLVSKPLIREFVVPVQLLEDAAHKKNNLSYSLTWRLLKACDKVESQISWLLTPDQDATIIFHLPERKTLERLLLDLCLVENKTIVMNDEEALLSIQFDSADKQDQKSRRVLSCKRYISGGAVWERTKPTWHTSRSIESFSEVSDFFGSGMVIFGFQDVDKIVIILPICTEAANTTLVRCDASLYAYFDPFKVQEQPEDHVLVAIGPTNDLYKLLRQCHAHIRSSIIELTIKPSPLHHPLSPSSGLGFCTWEALGAGREKPSFATLCDTLQKFEDRFSQSVSTLLIDDGWQQVSEDSTPGNAKRLIDFDLDPTLNTDSVKDFESTHLEAFLTRIKERFPHIEHIGVWMTLSGYWGGLDFDSFSTRYGPLVEAKFDKPFWASKCNNDLQRWCLPAPNRLEAFYDDYFSLLQRSGVSFVKVDDQSDWEWIQSLTYSALDDIDLIPSVYFDRAWHAMTLMIEKHFGLGSVIHCMAFGHRFLTQLAPSITRPHLPLHFRNSDDTFPNMPESHVWQIYHNALNACLSSNVTGIIADADMITSYMPDKGIQEKGEEGTDWATFQAAFRACFSSSKIWLSDSIENSERGQNESVDKLLANSKDCTASNSLGRLKTVQVGLDGPYNINNLPLPNSIFSKLTDEKVGSALKMTVCWKLDANLGLFGCLFSLWNTRYSTKSVGWITLTDIAQAIQEVDTSQTTRLVVFTPHSYKVVMIPWSSRNAAIEQSRSCLTSRPLISFHLNPSQWKIFSVTPALPIKVGTKTYHAACLGLADKYAGLTAVTEVLPGNKEEQGGDIILAAKLSRAGLCVFVVSEGCQSSTPNFFSIQIDGIDVHSSFIQTKRMEDSLLLIVDMKKHLKSVKSFDRSSNEWQVNLLASNKSDQICFLYNCVKVLVQYAGVFGRNLLTSSFYSK